MRLALCLEQTLGHRTHGQNLEAALESGRIQTDVLRIEYPERPRMSVPWALRGSYRAYRAVRSRPRYDVALFHTQTVALMAPAAMRGRPYVVSVDATPLQVDAMGKWYGHGESAGALERLKRAWYRQVFARSSGIVSWSEWAKNSLVKDYGVDPSRVLVAHPGAPESLFAIERRPQGGKVRILFVGGDFERKGGPGLLEAFAPLRDRAELVLVTNAQVPPMEGVRVERGVTPGSDRFIAAYSEADIFCLPTLGDCTSVAIGEAMAAGLPVVTTRIGSNEETVHHNETGLLFEAGETAQLARALETLVDDRALRERMGRAARADACERMNSAVNADRILRLLEGVA